MLEKVLAKCLEKESASVFSSENVKPTLVTNGGIDPVDTGKNLL
jgi:hypothetical protein